MLNLTVVTHSNKDLFQDVLLVAYGPNASRVVVKESKDSTEVIPAGRLYFVQNGVKRAMNQILHHEALIEIGKNKIIVMTSQAWLWNKQEKMHVQSKMDDSILQEMSKSWQKLQEPAEWIEADPNKLINFVNTSSVFV
jgi:hypothetical protein